MLLDRSGSVVVGLVTSALLLFGVVLYRRRSALPTGRQDRTLRNLAQWAAVFTLLTLLTDGRAVLQRYGELRGSVVWQDELVLRDHGFALAIVAVLLFVARPPRSIWAAVAVLAVPLLVAALPRTFDLHREALGKASGVALATEATASACLFALSSLAFVAAAWHLATDGGLLPKSRRPPGTDRVLRLRLVGPAVLAWTVLVAAFFALTEERAWQRASWLSDRTIPHYGLDHGNDFVWEALSSVAQSQDWLSWYAWLLTGIAVLAVLRAWRSVSAASPLEEPAGRLLFLTFFAVVVTLLPNALLLHAVRLSDRPDRRDDQHLAVPRRTRRRPSAPRAEGLGGASSGRRFVKAIRGATAGCSSSAVFRPSTSRSAVRGAFGRSSLPPRHRPALPIWAGAPQHLEQFGSMPSCSTSVDSAPEPWDRNRWRGSTPARGRSGDPLELPHTCDWALRGTRRANAVSSGRPGLPPSGRPGVSPPQGAVTTALRRPRDGGGGAGPTGLPRPGRRIRRPCRLPPRTRSATGRTRRRRHRRWTGPGGHARPASHRCGSSGAGCPPRAGAARP
ncbi:hypothetical protein ACVWXU_001171 [Streptomyces sp. TE33382]